MGSPIRSGTNSARARAWRVCVAVAALAILAVACDQVDAPTAPTTGLYTDTFAGNGCSLTQSVVATASATRQLTVTADGGSYCVRLFDVGNLTGDVTFSVSVLHP